MIGSWCSIYCLDKTLSFINVSNFEWKQSSEVREYKFENIQKDDSFPFKTEKKITLWTITMSGLHHYNNNMSNEIKLWQKYFFSKLNK